MSHWLEFYVRDYHTFARGMIILVGGIVIILAVAIRASNSKQ